MATMRNYVAAFLVTLLAIYGLISFVIITQAENGVTNQVSSDPFINKTFLDISSSITSQQSAVDSQSRAFESEEPKVDSSASSSSDTIVTSTKAVKGISVTQVFNLLTTVAEERLGIPPIVSYTAGIILAVSLLTLMWKVIRSGE